MGLLADLFDIEPDTEQDIKDMMREIRMALLEADVSFKVVKQLCIIWMARI